MPPGFAEADFFGLPSHLLRLRSLRRSVPVELDAPLVEVATSPEPTPFDRRLELDYRRARPRMDWGGAFTCAWFHVTGQVPAGTRGRVALLLDTDGEGTVYSRAGELVTSISSRVSPVELLSWQRGKNILPLDDPRLIDESGRYDVWVDASFNGKLVQPFGRARIRRLALVELDEDREEFAAEYLAGMGMLVTASRNPHVAEAAPAEMIEAALDSAWDAWKMSDAHAARMALKPALQGAPFPDLKLTAVGHGHLDLAWLWPVRETRRKAVRTYAYQLRQLQEYPGAVYGTSQPQQLAWIEESHPELHAQVVEAITEGRIEPQGGFWVEPDTNVPSGESLIRQAVYGQQYWERTIGRTVDVCWLPDTFGYSANLPQIIRGAGMDSFLTIKLTWNEVTTFPHRSFVWRGIDGSEVLVHMPPEGNYNSSAAPVAISATHLDYPEADVAPEALLVYGSGDGGGGPGAIHHSMLRAGRSLPGLPAVEHGTAAAFFQRLAQWWDRLPLWDGELYLEKHQGTYTTQSDIKKWNRRNEFALHDLEYLGALAWWAGEADYPRALLERTWRDHLLFQFHDILPGSSIRRVNAETVERQEEINAELRSAVRSALTTTEAGSRTEGAGASSGGARTDGRLRTEGAGASSEIPTNIGNSPRRGPGGEPAAADIPTNIGNSHGGWFVNTTPVRRAGHVKVRGEWRTYEAGPFETVALHPESGVGGVVATDLTLANQHVAAHWNEEGALVSLTAHGREFAAGELNRLVVHRDQWSYYDAWDINQDYREKRAEVLRPESVELLQDGPRVIRRSRYRHGRSLVQQDAVLTADAKYLSFETRVEWRETWRMLRAEFTPTVWSEEVTCDIQLGTLKRSTLEDTDALRAQFEVCAHRWVDVTAPDGSAGFTLMNDSKYGHRAKSGLISLNLLRSPVYPDRKADRGRHEFRYAIYPHLGAVEDSEAAALALDFNAPVLVGSGAVPAWLGGAGQAGAAVGAAAGEVAGVGEAGAAGVGEAPFVVVGDGVWLDVVKASEDGESLVVRLHETRGREAEVELDVRLPYSWVTECDLLERPIPGVGRRRVGLKSLAFTPFQIRTLRFER